MLTESEERRIEEIYENHAKLLIELQEKISGGFTRDLILILVLTLSLLVLSAITSIISSYFLLGIPIGIILCIFLLIHWIKKAEKGAKEEFEKSGFSKEDIEYGELDLVKSIYRKSIWGSEADCTKLYLKYLAMESRTGESKFKNFLYCSYTDFQLRESDIDELVKIFRSVRERVENMKYRIYSPFLT